MEREYKQHILFLIALILISGVVFGNTFKNSFIWDDADLIVNNRYIRSLKNIPFFFTPQYWNHHQEISAKGQYRPVRTATFTIDYALWKLRVKGYHLTNLLLHTLNGILIYFLMLRITSLNKRAEGASGEIFGWPDTFYVAFVTAIVFAIHPIHVESVTWIKNRSDLLTLLFYLLSLLLFISASFSDKKRGRTIRYAISLLCFVCSLFSKEMALSLPLILILYALCFSPPDEWKRRIVGALPFFGIAILYLLFKVTCLGMLVSSENTRDIGLYSNVLAVFKTFGYYARLLVFPFDLNAERLFIVPESLGEFGVYGSVLVAVVVSAFTIKTWKCSKVSAFATLWIFVTLLPASNILFLSGRPIAEQRLYIPSLGFCVIVALGIRAAWSMQTGFIPRKILRGLTVLCFFAILVIYSTATINRNYDWRTPLVFWTQTVEASPHSSRAYTHLGNALLHEERADEAIRHFLDALRIDPRFPETHNSLGNALFRQGKAKEAIRHYSEALRIDPEYAEAHNNLGNALSSQGRNDEGMRHYVEALRIKPEYIEAHYNLGYALGRLGRVNEAKNCYREVLRLEPDSAAVHNRLGNVLLNQGSLKEAIYHFSEALRIKPDFAEAHYTLGLALVRQGRVKEAIHHFSETVRVKPDFAEAHNNLGITLARERKVDEAIHHFSVALTIEPEFAEAHYNLGLALASQGKFNKAISHYTEALRIKPGHRKAREKLNALLQDAGKDGKPSTVF